MSLVNDLKNLKARIGNFEEEFSTKIVEVERLEKEELMKKLKEEAARNIIDRTDPVVSMNIGGEIYKCSLSILTSVKGTLFENLYQNPNNVQRIVFFDRSNSYFNVILNYIRSHIFNPEQFSRDELEDIKIEAEYYSLTDFIALINERLNKIEFVNFESSARYSTCGSHKLEDLSTKDLKTGICVQSSYYITIELNFEHEIEKMEIAGVTGNSSWAVSNGINAKVLTSTDKSNWKEVGTIPSNFGDIIITVPLKKSIAKYIKFQHNSYLGIGYLNLLN